MKFILGQKRQMTQLFRDDGTVVPVTVVFAAPAVVSAVKTVDKDKYAAVQIGAGTRKPKRLKKPQRDAWKNLGNFAKVREFRVSNDTGQKVGDKVEVSQFQPGDRVRVTGTSKGKGYAGVVKRHHFKGGPASHGHKDNLRAPGSSGATFPQHVLKGTRMAGRMGNQRVTVSALEVVAVKPESNELWLKGAIPGPRNGWVIIQTA